MEKHAKIKQIVSQLYIINKKNKPETFYATVFPHNIMILQHIKSIENLTLANCWRQYLKKISVEL